MQLQTMLKKCGILLTGLLLFQGLYAQPKTKMLLLGTFHFDNPGLDVAKFQNANVLSEKRQAEISEIIGKLKAFKPTKIFVEYPPEVQGRLDTAVMKYKDGQLTLKASEIHQIGVRLAKELDLPTIYGVDYRQAVFPYDSLVKVVQSEKQFGLLGLMKHSIDSIQNAFNAALKTHTLREMLLQANDEKSRSLQVGGYYQFLEAGGKDNHVGAYLTSEWWRRNMIIYANILKRLEPADERILVLFGAAHTALLHEMAQYSPKLELVPVDSVLR